jgi:MFS family permease
MGFIGPALAGMVIGLASIPWALGVQVILWGLAAVAFLATGRSVVQPKPSPHTGSILWRGSSEVMEYLRRDRPLQSLLVLNLVMVPIGISYERLLPVFAQDILGLGVSHIGVLVGVSSFGAALAGLILAMIGDISRKGRSLLVSASGFSVSLLLLACCRFLGVAGFFLFVVGLFQGIYLTLSNVLFQGRPPDILRGRVVGVWTMVWGILPFANVIMGAAADWLGASVAIGIAGAACALFCLRMSLSNPSLRAL